MLNNYILENKSTITNIDPRLPKNVIYNQQDPGTVLLEEASSEEIEILENGQTPLVTTTQKMELVIEKEEHLVFQDPIVLDNITYDIISKNITNVTNYNIRNRKFKPSNSFFITRNKSYCLGVLTANTLGDTRED